LNWVDTLVLLIVAISALIAFARGFMAEVLGIAAWVGAFFIANAVAPELRPMMREWLGGPDLADPAAYAAVFLVGLVLLSIITGMIGSAVRNSMLGGVDRTLGLVFGLARGLLILAAAYVGTGLVVPTERWPDAVAEARTIPYVYRMAMELAELLPPDYRPHVPTPPQGRDTTAADLMQPTPQGRATARP
jgi:membrane protein required for colicin V production